MPHALRTAAAERDFEEIGYQIAIADGRPETARKILNELADQCNKLAELSEYSQIGTTAPEIGEGVRLFTFKRWVIIFRYLEEGVIILESLMQVRIIFPGSYNEAVLDPVSNFGALASFSLSRARHHRVPITSCSESAWHLRYGESMGKSRISRRWASGSA